MRLTGLYLCYKDNKSIDKKGLIGMLEYLIDNIYVSVDNRIYRQCIGIPMGTDCAPLLANLFLFYYKYMKCLMKDNFQLAKMFSHIDDLLTLNNPYFIEEISNIYPVELILKQTTESETKVSYMDIYITIVGQRFRTSIFDKRDSFNCHIVNFPFLNSNIPAVPAYGIYISQLVRLGRICDDYYKFARRNHMVTSRLVRQGFRYDKLCGLFKKFTCNHATLFRKFGASVKQHDGIGLTCYV